MTLNQRHGRIVRENCNITNLERVPLLWVLLPYCILVQHSDTTATLCMPGYPLATCALPTGVFYLLLIRVTYRAYWVPPRLSDQQ